MGFRPEPRQYKLTFKGTDLDGLEVTIGSVTVAEWNRMMSSAAAAEDDPQARREANDFTLELFAGKLVSWNWEDEDGTVLPLTLESVMAQDRSYVQQVVTAWQLAIVGVRPTQGPGLENGAGKMSPEELELLATASESPGS